MSMSALVKLLLLTWFAVLIPMNCMLISGLLYLLMLLLNLLVVNIVVVMQNSLSPLRNLVPAHLRILPTVGAMCLIRLLRIPLKHTIGLEPKRMVILISMHSPLPLT